VVAVSLVKEQLVDYLYDELPVPARAAFAEHLRGCPGCSAEVASHQRTLGQARAALTGPLMQEPPARVYLAVMEAAKTKAKSAQRAAATDAPGFFARLWRTPWLLPAFGAASIATAVFLVRVLKNPEALPGQKPHPVDELVGVPAEPVVLPPPAAAPQAESQAESEKRAEQKPAAVETGRAQARAAVKAKRGARSDSLPGLDTKELGSGANVAGRFAQPPPPRAAGGKSIDDLLSEVRSERKAAAPKEDEQRAPTKKAATRDEEPLSWDALSSAGRGKKIAKETAKYDPFGDGYAAPPPAPAAPAAAPAPLRPSAVLAPTAPPSPSARPKPSSYAPAGAAASTPSPPSEPAATQPVRVQRERATEAAKQEATDEADLDMLMKDKSGKGAGGPSFDESVKKADRLFASGDWNAAADAYRDLLRRYPSHKDAPKWRERMNQSIVAVEEARKASDAKASSKAAKAKASDVLLREMK
jgi:hypothetical protein